MIRWTREEDPRENQMKRHPSFRVRSTGFKFLSDQLPGWATGTVTEKGNIGMIFVRGRIGKR